jgi:REP element-mobilizing transposase RayT
MPRARRIYLENAVYYVALEGSIHEPLFREYGDYLKYMELLTEYKKEYQFKLFSYALLKNSIYLLIEPDEEYPVSQIMQKITPTYTKHYNAKYDRTGHLFQKRYRSIYIEKSVYLPRLMRFIHLLPEVFQKEESFQNYPYSSHSAFTGVAAQTGVPIQEEVKEVVSYFSRGVDYERFMDSRTAEEFEFLEKKLSWGAVLGTEEFELKVRERIREASQKKEPEAVQVEAPAPPSHYTFRKTTVALSGLLMATIFLSGYSAYLGFKVPAISKTVLVSEKINAAVKTPLSTQAQEPVLDGTIWDVELITIGEDGNTKQIKDKIRFNGKGFESYYFMNQGFNRSNYTVTVNDNGVVTWETVQRNPEGEIVSWHGDWNGKKMEGMMSYQSSGQNPQDFSFMSRGVAQ